MDQFLNRELNQLSVWFLIMYLEIAVSYFVFKFHFCVILLSSYACNLKERVEFWVSLYVATF